MKHLQYIFDYSLNFEALNFREHPELYRVGKGEQGVLLVEPYKSEILPHWRFKTPEIAEASAVAIYALFCEYLKNKDFVGADMARKFLQMGYTRSRRYANYKGGKKYPSNPQQAATSEESKHLREQILPRQIDPKKAASARIFKTYWDKAKTHETYLLLKQQHLQQFDRLVP